MQNHPKSLKMEEEEKEKEMYNYMGGYREDTQLLWQIYSGTLKEKQREQVNR